MSSCLAKDLKMPRATKSLFTSKSRVMRNDHGCNSKAVFRAGKKILMNYKPSYKHTLSYGRSKREVIDRKLATCYAARSARGVVPLLIGTVIRSQKRAALIPFTGTGFRDERNPGNLLANASRRERGKERARDQRTISTKSITRLYALLQDRFSNSRYF